MPNPYYTASGAPSQGSTGSSAVMRAEFLALVAAFDKLPSLGGNAGQMVVINAGATGLTTSSALSFSGTDVTVGGTLTLAAGSAGAPTLRFSNSSTTGLWSPGAGIHAWSVSGTEVMRLSSSGLGINITPTAGLHVNKDVGSYIAKFQRPGVTSVLSIYTAPNEVYIDAEGAGNQLVFATVGTARARFNAAGSFLMAQTVPMIGIADDTSVLALFGSSTAVDNRARLELYGNTHATLARQAILRGDQIIFTASGAATEFGRFSAAGNLGIGFAPTANYRLDVNGTIRSIGGETTSGYGFRVLNSTANGGGSMTAKVGANAGIVISGDSGPVNYVSDSGGTEAEIGWRGIPGRLTSGGTTLALTDRGKSVIANGAGTITVDDGVFTSGDIVTIVNLAGAPITIAQAAGMTLRLAGTGSTGNRTLADNGIATIYWVSGSTQAIISGAGLT